MFFSDRPFVNNDYKIELVENYQCATKQDLNIREGNIIKQLRNDKLNIVNRNISGQTKSQYYQSNRNLIHDKANQKHICHCGKSYSNSNKARHEKSKKHQDYINNSKTLINNGTLNINITVNNVEDLNKILKTINK